MKDQHTIEITDELIVRFLTGEASPEEAMALHDWLNVSENKTLFEKFETVWIRTNPTKKPKSPDQKRAWKTMQDKIHTTDTRPAHVVQLPYRSRLLYKIAATIFVITVAGVFTYLKFNSETSLQLSAISNDTIREVVLPDQSRAVLSQHSKIVYAGNFSGDIREVHLSGEAFFNVTHHADKPFIVHTGIADVRVIGTAFNVAMKNGKVVVSVAQGKVLVYTEKDSVYLTPGKAAAVSSESFTPINTEISANANDWGYATRKFEFRNTLLSEVFACIEKSYPYSINVRNEAIKNCKLTATFENASAEYIVTLIAETLDLTLTKKDNVFYLEGKGCL